jgi:putative membrane protein
MNSVTTQMVSAEARPATSSPQAGVVLALVLLAGAAASLIGATSFSNWISESCLVLVGGAVLVGTSRRYPLTSVTYTLLLALALVVFTGAHYTYARVPLGEWMRHAWGFERNHFDRLGHFMQGAAPAMLFRELLRRRLSIRRGLTLFCLVSMTCLGIAAGFEILEWHYAVITGHGCTADCLGAQGDVWDAQQDMQMALLGSLAAQLVLAPWHERQISRLTVARA